MLCLVSSKMLLVHYLGVLVRELCACDLHPLALPALLLQLVTSECLMAEGSRPLCQLIHMRCVCGVCILSELAISTLPFALSFLQDCCCVYITGATLSCSDPQ